MTLSGFLDHEQMTQTNDRTIFAITPLKYRRQTD
jgi:hypothetical protein